MLLLIKEVLLYIIRERLMEEFTKRDLQVKYEEEIEAWFVYLDQQKFGKKLEKRMLIEIERFISERRTVEEILEELFEEPEWIIEIEKEFVECIPKNYFFKSVLGYA